MNTPKSLPIVCVLLGLSSIGTAVAGPCESTPARPPTVASDAMSDQARQFSTSAYTPHALLSSAHTSGGHSE